MFLDNKFAKVCVHCKKVKSLTEFHTFSKSCDINKRNYQPFCKKCRTPYYASTRKKRRAGKKECTACGKTRTYYEYYKERYSPDGFRAICKYCTLEDNVAKRVIAIDKKIKSRTTPETSSPEDLLNPLLS